MTANAAGSNGTIDRARLAAPAATVAALLILAAALSAHLTGLFERSIWGDEAITLLELSGHADPAAPTSPVPIAELKRQMAGSTDSVTLVDSLWTTDVHPPLYYLAADLWRDMLGPGIERLRLLSLLFVGLATAVFYATLRRAAVPFSGVAALIFLMSDFALFCSANARSYGLALLLVVLTLHLGLRSIGCRAGCRGTATMLGVCVGAAFLTHYFTLFICGTLLLWHGAVVWRRDRVQAVLPMVAAGLIGAAALPMLGDQLGARPEQFQGASSLVVEGWVAAKANFGAIARKPAGPPLARAVLIVIAIPLAAGLLGALRRDGPGRLERISTIALLALAANSLGILGLFQISDKTLLHGAALRYFGFALPFLVILLAFGIHALARGSGRRAATIALLVLAVQLGGWRNELRHQAAWREFGQLMQDSPAQRPLVVLIGAGRGAFGSSIYAFPGSADLVMAQAGGPWQADLARYDEIWLIAAPTAQRAVRDATLRIEEHPDLTYLGRKPPGESLDAVEVRRWRSGAR